MVLNHFLLSLLFELNHNDSLARFRIRAFKREVPMARTANPRKKSWIDRDRWIPLGAEQMREDYQQYFARLFWKGDGSTAVADLIS